VLAAEVAKSESKLRDGQELLLGLDDHHGMAPFGEIAGIERGALHAA
jgi:hypothetical protein